MDDDDSWDAYADGWDRDEGARAYAEGAFGSLVAVLDDAGIRLDGAVVLDFGCGTGLLTDRLATAGAAVNAVDTSTAMLAVLDEKVADRGLVGVTTSTELPPSPTVHDLIVCSSVCSFLDDYPGTVADLVDRLRPGGLFVQWDWEKGDDDEHGLSRGDIGTALRGAGLDAVVVDVGFVAAVGSETMRPLMGHGRRVGTDGPAEATVS